jgi:hypothetical protein
MNAQALTQLARRVIEKQVRAFGRTVMTYVAVTAKEAEEHQKPGDETVSSFSDFISTLPAPEASLLIKGASGDSTVEVVLIGPGGLTQFLTLHQQELS